MAYVDGQKIRKEYRIKFALNVAAAFVLAIIAKTVGDGSGSYDFFYAAGLIFFGMAISSWFTMKDFS